MCSCIVFPKSKILDETLIHLMCTTRTVATNVLALNEPEYKRPLKLDAWQVSISFPKTYRHGGQTLMAPILPTPMSGCMAEPCHRHAEPLSVIRGIRNDRNSFLCESNCNTLKVRVRNLAFLSFGYLTGTNLSILNGSVTQNCAGLNNRSM